MKVRSSVSFESGTKPVLTIREEFETAGFENANKTALFRAFKKYPKAKPESVVVVIENLDAATSPKV
jgi:hypothetical protein